MAFSPWYKEMTVYQIWPRSFCDGNGDGIGDLWGVLEKLDYIKSLGVDAIWFSPLYPSPNADWGYDISNYMDIHPDFGDLNVFRQVLDEAHRRGLKVFMDLVVNHTSDEHPWFKASRDKNSPYRDYYYWRPGRRSRIGKKKLLPPNNWTSLFEGGAWEYDNNSDEFYLHLFAKKQPDLNMENPKVREEVKKILRFWLDMGVDGLMIECHCDPDSALCDKNQQLTPEHLSIILGALVVRDTHMSTENLSTLRRHIDQCDNELLEILAKRMRIAKEIGTFKKEHNMQIVQAARYDEIMKRRVTQAESLGLSAEFMKEVMQAIHEESVKLQLSLFEGEK